MSPNSVVRASSPDAVEELTEKASLGIMVSRPEGRLDFGLKVPNEDSGRLVSACVAIAGPAATLLAAHAAGFGPDWPCCVAGAQIVLAGVLAMRPRQRRPRQ